MAKVSVIMPVYNVEKYFKQCIESVINQTLTDIEIIPVDDGSPDNCGKIMDEYAKKDSRIKPLHKENGGYGKAINAGLEVATGEYIGIVETDDWIEQNMYEKLYSQAKKFDSDVCKSGFYKYNSLKGIERQNVKWKNKQENIENIPDDISFTISEYPSLFMMHASIWSSIYKREFLINNSIKMNESRSASYQDFPFMAEVMCKARSISVIHDYMYHWRLEPNQGSSTTCKNEKLLIMPEQCERVKQIVKENNLYDILKNYMYRHFASANFAFFCALEGDLQKKYFEKCVSLFCELKDDKTFNNYFCQKNEKLFIKSCLNNRMRTIYSVKDLRRSVIQIHLNSRERYVKLFGKNIFGKDVA